MRLEALSRLYHTTRYLKPGQVLGRVVFRLHRPRIDRRPAPPLRPQQGRWVRHAWRAPSLLGPDRFFFLNQAHSLESARDWNHPGRDKLRLYNLHYFDDLSARDSKDRTAWQRALIDRWIAENPPAAGNGWEPYPLSLRIVNWVKWSFAGNALEPAWRDSLALQLRVLAQRVERHLLGNHLLANAKALVFGGLFFGGREADQWVGKGLEILAEQVPEQVLADGGHFERSPMYHAIVIEDLLDLVNLGQVYYSGALSPALASATDDWRARVPGMLGWLRVMSHPDGEIGFFNDAAFGIAPPFEELAACAARLGLRVTPGDPGPLTALDPSGYVRLTAGPAICLLDTAPIGPDYLPGHAHADTLSFEWSAFGQRVVVNGGTSRYGSGPERLRERGTAAHSTVQIDGQDSSEVWSGFRVARRARPFGRTIQEKGDAVEVICAHDGYRRLPGRPVHRRCWRLAREALDVVDTIEGRFGKAKARFHLHPEVDAEVQGDRGRLLLPGGRRIDWQVPEGRVELVPSTWHPEFGRTVPTRCIEVRFTGARTHTRFTWR